ncbi:MAG: hypothetical protein HRF50_00655 [Phycisphaerae bacterium]
MKRWGMSLAAGLVLALIGACVTDSSLLDGGKDGELINSPRSPGHSLNSGPGSGGNHGSGHGGFSHENENGDDNSNANGDNGNVNGDNGNVNGDNGNVNGDNGNVNGDNGNVNGDNGNVNGDNGNVNGDNGNDNGGGGPCPDGSFRISAALSGSGSGELEYRRLASGCQRFRARIDDAPVGTHDVVVDGVVVGQIVTDSRGRGELEFSTAAGTWPADFPELAIGEQGSVGGVLSGTFALDCSADPDGCGG